MIRIEKLKGVKVGSSTLAWSKLSYSLFLKRNVDFLETPIRRDSTRLIFK